MSNLKSMFERMNNSGGGDTDNGIPRPQEKVPLQPAKPKQTIEKVYQKKSQLEHILLRPDTYIGSVEHVTELMWVYDSEKNIMVQKNITYVPGLYKIFDEILVNAADNKQRDKRMDCIKVDINAETNTISVWNNGQGIPVAMHKEENMYVPTMIFGHLLTSSNYNDEEEKVTGGRNGYGAKLCNIFSTKFTVETASKEYKRHFKQTWGSNMSKASDPKIKESKNDDFTKIIFSPDLVKFKMDKLDDDIVSLMSRRAFDIAASTRGVKVFLNGTRLPIKNFKDYMDMYIKSANDDEPNMGPLKVCYDTPGERWEVGMCISNRGFQQVSFVNSIATTKGGRHVDYIADMIVKQVMEVIKKKNKGGAAVKPFQIKNHMWVFINCLIVNPTFDSQTKENMTLQSKNFGSKCTLSEPFIKNVVKSGVVESVLTWAKFKAQTQLEKSSGKKMTKLKGIPKLEDANEAGTRNAIKCTLILTEGDSAKSLAVSGLGVIGRDYYGVFPLRGKLLNVREATHKQILENAEINNLIKILGLQYNKKYRTEEDMKTLRYGKVMIMTDQDQDGSHIKGLLINFIHFNWPELIRQDFLEEFITPIVKVTKRNEELSFYSLPEFEEWKTNTPNQHTYSVKYYKGLGTSTSKEAKEYFTDMARHRIRFRYTGQEDDDHILLAFSKKHIDQRKEWLTNFMVESKRRKEIGLPERYLYAKDTKFVSYADFVNLELVLFSNADNVRSIPSMVDGLKPGQRKVLFTCIKRNDKKEVKVAQLAGSVAEQSAYHHGEVSLCMTIVNLAQNFVGANNINLLEPRGQFGTRLTGGKDSASPRYIFTKMSPLTRMIFHPNDDALLKHEYDDNKKIEPVWYIPILPMVLVNGADGIGTGWMTKIPNYNPREIVTNIRALLDGGEVGPMMPWYKNFKGTIDDAGESRYILSGEIAIIGNDKVEITELPVGTWTQTYKENVLESLLHGSEKVKAVIADYKEYNTDTTVKFVVTCLPGQMSNIEKEGYHKIFKLQSLVNTTSMCVFDELGCLRKMENTMDILKEFYALRLKMYTKRKDYMEGILEAETARLTNQARFIMEKCSGELVVENKKRKKIVEELLQRGYQPDPVAEWKKRQSIEEDEEEDTQEEQLDDESTAGEPKKKPVDPEKAFKSLSDVKKFDYLLGMSMWMLTDEKKNELLKQRDQKVAELDILKRKSNSDLWREDLDVFMEKLDVIEEKERREEMGAVVKKEKKVLGGKKKINLNETLPTETGTRIKPEITEDIKKKIQTAVKAKDLKTKKVIKKETSQDEADEFDTMVKPQKSLKEKLGMSEVVGEKKKGGRPKKPKDGMKQTTLNFPKKETTTKGKSKKTSDSDFDSSESDVGFNVGDKGPTSPKDRTASRRNAAKAKVYTDYDIEDGSSDNNSDAEVLHDNKAVKEADKIVQEKLIDSDDSDAHMSDEDMFEEEVAPKKAAPKRKRAPKEKDSNSDAGDSSDSDFKKSKQKKKKVESDDEFVVTKEKPKPKSKKKVISSDDDDEDFHYESDAENRPPPKGGRGRGKNKKYVFDSDDSN